MAKLINAVYHESGDPTKIFFLVLLTGKIYSMPIAYEEFLRLLRDGCEIDIVPDDLFQFLKSEGCINEQHSIQD